MSDVVVVGHQPQYMPYIGIMHKISRADIFVVVDHVQYVRRYFQNRTYIKVGSQPLLLTVPVLSKGRFDAAIKDIEINHETPWIKKHLKSIRLGYSRAPFFRNYYDQIERIFLKKHLCLADFTMDLLLFFLDQFEMNKDIRFSSQLGVGGAKTGLLVDLTRAVNGTVYLSGEGAKDYVDEQLLVEKGIQHEFVVFKHPRYPQLGNNFLEGMGCVDLLMNQGRAGRKYIFDPGAYLA